MATADVKAPVTEQKYEPVATKPAAEPLVTEATSRTEGSIATTTPLIEKKDPESGLVPFDEVKPEKTWTTALADWFVPVKDGAPPPAPAITYSAASFLGAVIGISTLGLLTKITGVIFIIGSFGAMAVLIFSAIGAPVAQPRNVIVGNVIGAICGVSIYKLFEVCELELPAWTWLAAGLAVGTTIFFQERARAVHPPGGATALIFILGPAKVQAYSWGYILCPVLAGSIVMVMIAFLWNKAAGRTYPQYWW
jgi:CBS-domain-containing membrane protein